MKKNKLTMTEVAILERESRRFECMQIVKVIRLATSRDIGKELSVAVDDIKKGDTVVIEYKEVRI